MEIDKMVTGILEWWTDTRMMTLSWCHSSSWQQQGNEQAMGVHFISCYYFINYYLFVTLAFSLLLDL